MNTRGLGSQLKDSIPVTELSASGPFENHDLLRKGFSCVKNELLPSHPLELSEKNFQLNQDKMNFSTLRNIQGLFAPLKLQMEFKAVQQLFLGLQLSLSFKAIGLCNGQSCRHFNFHTAGGSIVSSLGPGC
ncbi:proteasome maturation protein isoform X3 [Saccopteryx bilineata]|uniref:proteasome maturation protein isoform X3 n=1 Tax=Saccopteryx bilineata TaxID=59482 RepID=UPI00338D397C